jgi:glycosyltransferase involved in cell wall biosynthesis
MFGRYAAFARAPRHEIRHGVEVWRPRYLVVPKVGAAWTPRFLFAAGLRAARRLLAQGQRFDVIDAHYFHPDGVAAAHLARALGLPLVITGRGTDLTLIPDRRRERAQIVWAAHQASALVTVCDDLRQKLLALGAPAERTLVLRNGVDLQQFAPRDRAAARRRLGLDGFVALSVGSLIPRKGHELTIGAMARVPDATLLIAGSGPLREDLEALARRLGVDRRVRFLGEVPHADLPDLYTAADAMVLASSREGWANVLLEAMACGAPVVATAVNGAPEVVRAPEAGVLVGERTADALVAAIVALRRAPPARAATRRYAEGFGWTEVARANRDLLAGLAGAGRTPWLEQARA